jgi:hypothetical protein
MEMHLETNPSIEHSLRQKNSDQEKLPEIDTKEFVAAQNKFQVALIEALAASYTEDKVILPEEFVGMDDMPENERKQFKAAAEFSPNYGASYKFLIRTDEALRAAVEAAADPSISVDQKSKLIEEVLEKLKAPQMLLRNKIMQVLKIGEHVTKKEKEKGVVSHPTYNEYIYEGGEELFQQLLAEQKITEKFLADKEQVRQLFKNKMSSKDAATLH